MSTSSPKPIRWRTHWFQNGGTINTVFGLAFLLSTLLPIGPENFLYEKIIPILLPIYGTYLLASGILSIRRYRQALHWPKVTATVTKSQVGEERATTILGRFGIENHYQHQVEFTYTVDGKTYTGDRPDILEISHNDKESEQGRADLMPVGTKITLYHNPTQPDDYMPTQATNSWGVYILQILLGTALLTIGIFLLTF